jgi:SAM-dependent methyltransferase
VVFVYSNSAHYNNEDKSPVFYGNANSDTNEDTLYGWEYQDCWHEGTLYKAAITPDPIPYHTSIILFAADHLRSFRRSAYEAVGGYDASLGVLDDQDLMARLRMHGKFYHINECLYLYRIYHTNSWILRNQEIASGMIEMQKKYIRPLAEAWCIENNLPMIDLCGGINPKEGYLSIDLTGADITADLNERWPFETSSIGIIRASDAIEHLKSIVFTMSEIHRVLVPGGYLIADTPSTSGKGSFMDPSHITHINKNSFWYYTRQSSAQYIRNTEIRFQEIVLEEYYPNDWCRDNDIIYVRSDLLALKAGGPKIMGAKLI